MFVEQFSSLWCMRMMKMHKGAEFSTLGRVWNSAPFGGCWISLWNRPLRINSELFNNWVSYRGGSRVIRWGRHLLRRAPRSDAVTFWKNQYAKVKESGPLRVRVPAAPPGSATVLQMSNKKLIVMYGIALSSRACCLHSYLYHHVYQFGRGTQSRNRMSGSSSSKTSTWLLVCKQMDENWIWQGINLQIHRIIIRITVGFKKEQHYISSFVQLRAFLGSCSFKIMAQ